MRISDWSSDVCSSDLSRVEEAMRAPLTTQGAQRLRAELDELKSVKRPAVINAIAEARAHGDLKENAEYHAAREQQGFIEGRIKKQIGRASWRERGCQYV